VAYGTRDKAAAPRWNTCHIDGALNDVLPLVDARASVPQE
jgi:hypothetical protein